SSIENYVGTCQHFIHYRLVRFPIGSWRLPELMKVLVNMSVRILVTDEVMNDIHLLAPNFFETERPTYCRPSIHRVPVEHPEFTNACPCQLDGRWGAYAAETKQCDGLVTQRLEFRNAHPKIVAPGI